MKPTEEQFAITSAIQATDSNIIINALAGTGKTATLKLVEAAANARHNEFGPLHNTGPLPILYLVFNSANAKAAEFKLKSPDADKRMLGSTTVLTLNALGHRIWMKTCASRVQLSKKKTQELFSEAIKELPKPYQREASEAYWEIISAVNLAKSIGYFPERYSPRAKPLATWDDLSRRLDEEPSPIVREFTDELLNASVLQAYKGVIDFNDQVYMPAVFGGTFPRFPFIMVDEYQDLNPCNHQMLRKLAKNSRLVGVGDPWQSIYAFRGAQPNGMGQAKAEHSMTELGLSVSFRCPEAVVKAARWRVPHFKWFKEGGHVEVLEHLHHSAINDEAVFICRNNAPLFRLAMRFLSAGRGVNVSGSDVGPKLILTMKRLGSESMTRKQTKDAIDHWLAEREAKSSKSAPDIAACMHIFADHGNSLGQAITYAEHLFAQTGSIRMMTGHKSKGLEFPTVYHLDPWLCREDEQDLNLRYVITTRAESTLYEIDSERITW